MAEDRETFGVAYWHRDFQLPGVYVCPKHQLPLVEAGVKANGIGRFLWYCPESREVTYKSYDPRKQFGASYTCSTRPRVHFFMYA